ncbi:MAG: glycine cleavage system aminomethyltransferase GcvT [Desulfovibrionaceae bacterium]
MSDASTPVLTTPLTDWHRAAGAKMAPFGGFDMPIQYSGILAEHEHTRTRAAVFDICHMGEFRITGPKAAAALEGLLTQRVDTLAPGKCRYGFILNPSGGILDDCILYRLAEAEFMLVVNAACRVKDREWLAPRLGPGAELDDVSDVTGKIDLQGPQSIDVLEAVLGSGWRDLKYFNFRAASFDGAPLTVSRTGYTGELGYELYLPADKVLTLWEALLARPEVVPAGLGARDTLRLEAGLPLYGQDLDEDHTPVEAGYGAMAAKTAEFVGKAGLARVRERLVALTLEGRRAARHLDRVMVDDCEVGHITSGSFAPSLGHPVALAWIHADSAEAETFAVRAARAELIARRTALPFYDKGSVRMAL